MYGFAGADFEPEGINLSGVAGHEMFRLYQSAQYYQRVLDRFFRLSPKLEAPSAKSFVSAATVTTYFSHLIRASTQKAKVWSEVAKTYHSLDRPKLAQQVVARAYTATYMESTILAGIMRRVLEEASPEDKAAIVASIDSAARSYRQALLNMQTVYAKVSAALNFMGFAADYIPFPALDAKDGNAFDKLWTSASTKLQLAIARENEALAQRRQYETDAQSFRSELMRIRTEYENELASICGTFVGDDGQIYPAVSAYAEKSVEAAAIGDPCGLLGNGQLYEVSLGIGSARLEVAAVRQQLDNVEAEIASEERRVREQCELVASEVQFLVEQDGQANSLQAEIDAARSDVDGLRATQAKAAAKMQTWSFCSPTLSFSLDIKGPGGSTSINPGACYQARKTEGAMSSTSEGIVASEESIRVGEQRLRKLQQATMRWQLGKRCDEVELESQARVRSMVLRLAELGIAARKTGYNVLLAQAKHRELENQAQRLLAQQQDALQMAVDIAAARNDPNVRIYKNDAILAADRTFGDALAETYRLTKVYEYYTSQSYEKLGDLYLVRMAQHGEPSLEAYLADLGKAFDRFEEQYGNPDVRVAVLSLRDDILEIPRLSARGQALSHTERVRLLRERLVSTSLLDERGYRVIPFGTRLDLASPLTRAHKIQHLEAEIDGTSVGDDLGRVYVTQRGTGVVQGVSGATSFYAFPERTAVLDVSFNGHQVFAPEVYKSERLRDRPLINTAWQLILNQRDEAVNQDIDLNALTDIRLYVFYTDFTAL